ncbi:hypothetical protein ACVGXX_00200, partial [Enterobacter intestinihominis]
LSTGSSGVYKTILLTQKHYKFHKKNQTGSYQQTKSQPIYKPHGRRSVFLRTLPDNLCRPPFPTGLITVCFKKNNHPTK